MYEVRERPAKTFSWKVFVLSNILVEIPWSGECKLAPIWYVNEIELTMQSSSPRFSSCAGTTPSATRKMRHLPTPSLSAAP
jgi:hypothetical protein